MILKLIKDNRFILLIVCIITFFINNNVIEPDIMESRNLVTAREMVTDGNWIVPTMNGDIRLEKPPFPTWVAALCEYISCDNIILQRSMSAIMASLLVFFFYKIANEIFNDKKTAFISSLFICTCYNVILTGRTATWDIYCHSFMLGAILFLIKAFKYDKVKFYILSGVFLGLSFMSKGPVSFYALLLPFLISFFIFKKPICKNNPLSWKLGLLLLIFVITGLWWYIFIYLNHYNDMAYVASKESGSWINRNVRPWWYYWKFFLETGIWSLLLLISMSSVFWYKKKCKSNNFLFVLIWLISNVILLSFFPEKKSRYLFPILIPSSYVMGWFIINVWNEIKGINKFLYLINSWIINIVIIFIPIIAFVLYFDKLNISINLFILFSVILWGIAYYLIIQTIKLNSVKYIHGIVILFMVTECLVFPHLNEIINNPNMKSIKETRYDKSLNNIPFYYNKDEELRIETVYAAGKKIRPIDIKNIDTIKNYVPFILITHKPLNEYKELNNMSDLNIKFIDLYDDNHRPKSNKRYYREALVNYMNLIDISNE